MKSMIIYQNKMIISMISIYVLISLRSNGILCKNDNFAKNCRGRDRLIENEKGDLYALIDATLGQKLMLQCHYCNENDDGRPKIWYKFDEIGTGASHEVDLDMNNNDTENRIHVNKEHSLVIRNFTETDKGLYYCQRLEGDQQEKYNYLIDLIFKENITSFETGNFTDWRKYYEEHFVHINTLFLQSQGTEFRYIRETLKVEMELITQWKPWGICMVCGRPKNEGIRKKTGLCRIKITHKVANISENFLQSDLKYLTRVNVIACRSELLARVLPGIANLTRIIPNFIEVQACEDTCNPDAEGLSSGWKTGKTAAFKYRKTVVLAEKSHLTLICPESTLENKVVWKRNGKILKAGESVPPANTEDEPRIIVDTFNTLYLVNVQESEEGNYTCQVDDIRMQQVVVFIFSKSKLLSQAFVRHMMYLGLILSLSLPCYFGGVIIACSRKRFFKNYEQLKELEESQLQTMQPMQQ